MEQARLKYRIVGGIVLLAVAAILVPLLNEVRQPLPAGPQAIDIPAEPADGVTAALPADGALSEGSVPEPQDLPEPLPAPPLTEEGSAPAVIEPAPLEPAPRDTVPAPVAKPTPVKPAPIAAAKPAAVKPSPVVAARPTVVQPAPVAKPVPPKPAVASPPVAAKPAPVAKPPAPVASAPGAQRAWVVQLGVYGNIKTAIDLREKLRRAGYSAFTEEVATPHGKALRVRVGPDLDRAKALTLRDRLARETGHDGIVMAYP